MTRGFDARPRARSPPESTRSPSRSWRPNGVHSIFLASWGTTPGKRLLNIRLSDESGRQLSFGTSFSRSISVLIKGLGLGIPLVALFCQVAGYKALKHDGITSWDGDSSVIVRHERVGNGRILAIILVVFIAIVLMIIGSLSS